MRVILIAAQSLDGRITFHDSAGTSFTSEADRRFFREAMAGFDCSVMGAGTFRASEKKIRAREADGRLLVVMTREAGAPGFENRNGVVEFTGAMPGRVVDDLRARGMRRCALLGGGKIYGAFLAADLVDEVWLTLEPRIFGAGVPFAGGLGVDVKLKLLACEQLSADTLCVKYEVVR